MVGTGRGQSEGSAPREVEPERLLRYLIEEARDGLVLVAPSGIVAAFNPAAERLSGRSAQSVIGILPVRELFPSGVWCDLERRLGGERFGGAGRLEPTDTELLSGAGDRAPIELWGDTLVAAEDATWLVCGLRDRRPRVTLEERLARAEAQVERGERPAVLVELAAAAAHELNQPLTSILGYADLLRRGLTDGSPQAATVDILLGEAERLAEIVRKIGRVQRYATKPYVGEFRIVDLDRAAETKPRDVVSLEGEKEPG